MGAKIHMVARAKPGLRQGYLQAGTKAIKHCLALAGIHMDEIGMLINSGVFPDGHIQEPAFASMLQGKLYTKLVPDTGKTFSFDLHTGGGSVLLAIRILSGFIESGKMGKGMVVAGDSEPLRRQSKGYHFSDEAVAIILEKGTSTEGFIAFSHGSFPVHYQEYSSLTNYGSDGLLLTVEQGIDYVSNCIEHADEMIGKFLKKERIRKEEIDLLIPSQAPVEFARGLKKFFPGEKVLVLDGEERPYSAGPGIALEKAMCDHRFASAGLVLFVSAGAGISINLALYRKPK